MYCLTSHEVGIAGNPLHLVPVFLARGLVNMLLIWFPNISYFLIIAFMCVVCCKYTIFVWTVEFHG